MGGWYYLMSQLPALTVSSERPLPVTEEYFIELCSRFLGSRQMAVLKSISLEPPRVRTKTGSVLLDTWYENERMLRFALAKIRAVRMKKDIEIPADSIPPDIVQYARTACGMDSPLAAEEYLNEIRGMLLDRITPFDQFSTDAVYLYALKLKLAQRMKSFTEEAGAASYRMIYDHILGESK